MNFKRSSGHGNNPYLTVTTSTGNDMNSDTNNTSTTTSNDDDDGIGGESLTSSQADNVNINPRAKATTEANDVLNTMAYQNGRIENFNLLGVVTSPRMLLAANMSSHNHNNTSTGAGAGAASSDTSSAGTGSFMDYIISSPTASNANTNTNTNTSTLSSVTGSISKELESLNSTIYSYSRNYLAHANATTNYYASAMIHGTSNDSNNHRLLSSDPLDFENELLQSMMLNGDVENKIRSMEELPKDLVDLDLTSVEGYLRKCGGLANSFEDYLKQLKLSRKHGNQYRVDGLDEDDYNYDEEDNDEDLEENAELINDYLNSYGKSHTSDDYYQHAEEDPISSVPEIFSSPFFDLTDPKTFESLLVLDDNAVTDDDDGDDDGNQFGSGEDDDHEPIIKLSKPEKLTQYLDTIELGLLNQVRSKSDSFFRETNRFSYLKSLVADLVDEVKSLRSNLEIVKERSVIEVELIPIMDRRRKSIQVLGMILDQITEVVNVKSSVAGLIASGDFLGAVEAIHKARSLLTNSHNHHHIDGDGENGQQQQQQRCFPLGKVVALHKINDQLAQYENLVVRDLSNDLVELFLSWNISSNSITSITGGTSSSSSNSNNTITLSFVKDSNSFLTTSTNGINTNAEQQRIKVKHTIMALKKCKKISTMADIYREKLSETIRVTIRTIVNECAFDAANTSSAAVAATKKNKNSTATATIVSIPDKNGVDESLTTKTSITEGVTSMTFEQFMDCLDMIFEQSLSLLTSAAAVNKFCLEEGISLKDDNEDNDYNNDHNSNVAHGDKTQGSNGESRPSSNTNASSSAMTNAAAGTTKPSALSAASDLSHKSISELLRIRKDAHSLITFEDMRRLWDSCLAFTLQVEKVSAQKAYGLRSTLLAQAKAFVERKHEANMASLVAALDGERWNQCDVSAERQAVLDRLCSGRAVLSSFRDKGVLRSTSTTDASPVATVEGKRYRVVWSSLLLIESIMSNVACAAHFQTLATNVVGKVSELLRLFNSRATQLVLGAGAIHSAARLKSINAKHLALVTQCVGIVLGILPHIRAALMAQLPSKQHALLVDLDNIKKEYTEHHDKILSKFVSIIGGIVEHGLISRIAKTDFDERSILPYVNVGDGSVGDIDASTSCCRFIDGVITNTRKMHQVLVALLPSEDLMDVFSRIFSYLDSKIPKILIEADADEKVQFQFPVSIEGKRRVVMEVNIMAVTMNNLSDVRAWDFGAMKFLERKLEIPSDNKVVETNPIDEEKEDNLDNISGHDDNDTHNNCEVNEKENQLVADLNGVESLEEADMTLPGTRREIAEFEPKDNKSTEGKLNGVDNKISTNSEFVEESDQCDTNVMLAVDVSSQQQGEVDDRLKELSNSSNQVSEPLHDSVTSVNGTGDEETSEQMECPKKSSSEDTYENINGHEEAGDPISLISQTRSSNSINDDVVKSLSSSSLDEDRPDDKFSSSSKSLRIEATKPSDIRNPTPSPSGAALSDYIRTS